MTVKRTRTGNDDAEADQTEVEQCSAPWKSPLNQKLSVTVAPSPVLETTTTTTGNAESSNCQSKLGGFLEKCRYCRRRIPEGVEVFMYR